MTPTAAPELPPEPPPPLRPAESPEVLSSPEGSRLFLHAPEGAREQRPITLVLTGREERCGELFRALDSQPFVLCWVGEAAEARDALREGLHELKRRHGPYVSPGGVLLISEGRTGRVAARLLREEPSFFSRAVLADFEAASWTSTSAKVFAERGGLRLVLIAPAGAIESARRAAHITAREGADAIAIETDGVIDAWHLDWALLGDPRYAPGFSR